MTSVPLITIVVTVKLPEWQGRKKITLNSISVDQTWQKVILEKLGILRESYLLKGGKYHAELHENIRVYCKKFQKQMNKYVISILPPPKTLASPSMPELPRSSTKGTKRKIETSSQFDAKAVRYFNQSEELHDEGSVQAPIPRINNDLVFRSEDTMTGNIMPSEEDLKVAVDIRNFIVNRISNRDILQIRLELQELKKQSKYMALIRMASFTAGFLENSFLQKSG